MVRKEIEPTIKKINNLLKGIDFMTMTTPYRNNLTRSDTLIRYEIKNKSIYIDLFLSIVKKIINIYKIICTGINTISEKEKVYLKCRIKIDRGHKTLVRLNIYGSSILDPVIFDYGSFYVIARPSDIFKGKILSISIYKLKCDNITKEVFEKILSMCMDISKVTIRSDSLKNYIKSLTKKYDIVKDINIYLYDKDKRWTKILLHFSKNEFVGRTTLDKLIDVIDDISKLSDDFILELGINNELFIKESKFKIVPSDNEDEKSKLMEILKKIASFY